MTFRYTCFECEARWDGPEPSRDMSYRTPKDIIKCPQCGNVTRLGCSPISADHARGWTHALQVK